MSVPGSTYRVQVRDSFGFDAVAGIAAHLAALGVTHVYLSPILQAVPGSPHGYDVLDHTRLSDDAGGREAFDRLAAALAGHGMSAIADVVPNHMAIPVPESGNRPLWSVLADGPGSEYGNWFDVDWTGGKLLMPVLGDRIGQVLEAGELTVDPAADPPVLRYHDHDFPLRHDASGRSGHSVDPDPVELPDLLQRQWYRPAWWRVGDEELNYRRFFDVTTLVAIRVEDHAVFDATHALLMELVASGALTGLRIDHPDGLADPRSYLRRLARASGDAWVVVEKILEDGETLPADWACAGTTGYDALNEVQQVFVDPAGAAPLSALLAEFTGSDPEPAGVLAAAKYQVLTGGLQAELNRLAGLADEICRADLTLRDHTGPALRAGLVELLVGMRRYRAYVVPGEPAPEESVAAVEQAAGYACGRLPAHRHATVDLLRDLALGRAVGRGPATRGDADRRREFAVRFQQTCGPVMAKGVEDTAFYRWHRLVALNEVGASLERFGSPPEHFHAFAGRLARDWPATMTTLSTHDTKRSEDARARLLPLAEAPDAWAEAVRAWSASADRYRGAAGPDRPTEYLFWQVLVATWDAGPPEPDRVTGYLLKAVREAKLLSTWTEPDGAYEQAVDRFARGVLEDAGIGSAIGAFVDRFGAAERAVVLGQKLVQLTMPGVPDVYQGTELVDRSLVDPDNRRPVDFARAAALLADLDAGTPPDGLAAEKLLVVSRALRLRREHPEWFAADAGYRPLESGGEHLLGFVRADSVITLATRLPVGLDRAGGWAGQTLDLPPGGWVDRLTGRDLRDRERVADLLATLPVALLVRS